MDSATWCWTPAPSSAARRLRPEVSKNSSTALSSNEGELARSITTCAPAMASLSPSPVMVLTPVLGEAATTSWPPWRRMATVFEPIRPVPPMTTIFMVYPPLLTTGDLQMASNAKEENIWASTRAHNANLRARIMQTREEKHGGVPVEHAARRAVHNVDHVAERGCRAFVPGCPEIVSLRDSSRAYDLGALTHEGTGDFLANDARGTRHHRQWHRNARSRMSPS